MSLEERLAELTEAVKANSELLTILTSKARASIEAPKVKVEETKVKSDEAEEVAPKRRGRKPKAKVPTPAEMKNAAQAYLDAAEDEDDYKARRATIKSIVEKFGADRFTEIPEEHRLEAIAVLNGGGSEDADDEDGDEEDDVV